MYSAFFVVRSECASPNFHVDYAREVGLNALTLMTPLDDVDDTGGFQLLYNEEEVCGTDFIDKTKQNELVED